MLARVAVISLNTYREAVRARVLHGLFGLAIGTGAYALVVGQFALRDTLRVVSDLGAASISLYAIVVAIVLGATSLHRELEHKTVFPILARPIRRWEYLVGKYLGTLLTLAVFVAANAGALLLALGALSGANLWVVLGSGLGSAALAAVVAIKRPRLGIYVPMAWAAAMVIAGWLLASGAIDDRRVIVGAASLTVCEVAIVAAIATLFSSFSSPFLTAIFTFGVFIVGRSADTLARLPHRVFGKGIQTAGELMSRVVPNLMVYVPPRSLLTGEAAGVALSEYVAWAALSSLAWAAGLLAFASLVFRRRDFL